LLHDVECCEGKMNGKNWECGKFARGLRVKLWAGHLAMEEDNTDLTDPILCWEKFDEIAKSNRKMYELGFQTMHRNGYKKMKDIPAIVGGGIAGVVESCVDEEKADMLKTQIRGFVVTAAIDFLRDENLLPGIRSKAYLVPKRMFV